MKYYTVVVTRTGTVCVAAEDPSDALENANQVAAEDVDWDDDWEATDVVEVEDPDFDAHDNADY